MHDCLIVTITKYTVSLAEATSAEYKKYFWEDVSPATTCSASAWCFSWIKWVHNLVSAMPKSTTRGSKVKKDFFPVASRESMRLFPKQWPLQGTEAWGFLFREAIYSHIGKHYRGGHSPVHIQFNACISEHAQFKVIVQKGKMADIFLDIPSKSQSICLKG